MLKMLLGRVGSIWFGGIKTFWEIWGLSKIQKMFVNFTNFLSVIFWTKTCSIPPVQNFPVLLDKKWADSSCKQYIMGISKHFGTENYTWRLDIVQNLCELCLVWFFGPKMLPPNHILLRATGKSNPFSRNSQLDEINHFKQLDQILQSKK